MEGRRRSRSSTRRPRRGGVVRRDRCERRVAVGGAGTRANIDEFTKTTALGVEQLGGAGRGKAIIILNPAEPPIIMRDTIFCAVSTDADEQSITRSVEDMVAEVATFVPGYRLRSAPQFDDTPEGKRVTVFLEIEGSGDYLRRTPGTSTS